MENDNAPATKADIAQLRNEVANNKQEVLEAIERVETTLLTEFQSGRTRTRSVRVEQAPW
jgi:hypothetical protein